MAMGLSEQQLATLYDHISDGFGLLNTWLNSEALWELVGGTMGFVLVVTLIAMIITKIFAMFNFRAREY